MARPRGDCRTDFEAWLLGAMAEAGITDYSVLATKAGVDTATIQRACSGVTEPSIGTLKKLAWALGTTVNDLVELTR